MSKKNQNKSKKPVNNDIQPLMVSQASSNREYETKASDETRVRRNLSGNITRTDRYKNIDDGLIPFRYSTGIKGSSNINIRDAVILCQKCYYNFAIFRNTIDLMTEFSSSNIYF
jgi:hypothetical protein